MSRREFHDLTFEKGVLESVSASMAPASFARSLQNWEPEAQGNLRVRTGWINTSTTGAPATRKTRGVGTLATQTIFQTPALVQQANASGATPSFNVSWPAATTAGNLLVLVLTAEQPSAFTPPAGWVEAKTAGAGAGQPTVAIYYKANAASESGAVTVSLTAAAVASAWLAEFSNAAISPLDVTASATGTTGAGAGDVNTGTTAATAQSHNVVIGVIGDDSAADYSAQTADFTEQVDLPRAAVYTRITTAAAAQGVTATASTNGTDFAGAIAVFKAAAVTTDTTEFHFLVANATSATAFDIYEISEDDLAAGTWTNVDASIAVTTTTWPVAFASGLGGVIYTSDRFSTLRRWTSGTGASLAGTPAGKCIAFHANRFFVAGTTANPSRLWYSEIGDHTKFWDVPRGESSLSNSTFFEDIGKDDGENIEDIATFGGTLLVAKRTSLHVLSGRSIDSFVIDSLSQGGGYPGRCICSTPYGAVIAGDSTVWLFDGSSAEAISKPIEDSYSLTGSFVSTAYVDGRVYICDSGSQTMFVFNIITGTWSTEHYNDSGERPMLVFSRLDRLYEGPNQATIGSLLSYRDFPQTRERDANHGMAFEASTPEMVLVDPSKAYTPLNLHLQLRQHGGNSSQTGLTVTPTFDGTEGEAQTIDPQDSAGVFRKTIGIGSDRYGKGITTFQIDFSQTVAASEESLLDIEAATLEFDVEDHR